MVQRENRAFVIGSGPNGVAAAITLQRACLQVSLLESKVNVGGGMRTAELTLPGYLHDVCSAIHPMAAASPFFRSLPLDRFALEFIDPPVLAAHPFDDGSASVRDTVNFQQTCRVPFQARILVTLERPLRTLSPKLSIG
jgi:phytoene dehydrogenase-like protein